MEQPTCPNHGLMQKVPGAWCGEWWLCAQCTHSVMRPLDALLDEIDAASKAPVTVEGE